VANAISAASSADTSQPTSRVALPAAVTTQPVRTLTLGLTPQNLGEVTVRLSMNGSKLSVVLSVEQPEAAQLLAQDRETLEGLLRSTGYKVDTISIQLAPQAVTSVTTGSVTASGDQAQSGSADTGSDGMGRSGQKDRGESGNRTMKEGSEHGQAESHRNRGALYI
jgi:flagellar hook-length control protein FliK